MNIKKLVSFRSDINITKEEVQPAREYINAYWNELICFHPKDDESLLGLPYPYIVPSVTSNLGFDFNEMYYWDSYFIVQGLLDEEHKDLVLGILDNIIYLFNRFKIIPNASRTYLMGRSQPPLLTSLIFDIFNTYKLDNKWLKDKITVAQNEYNIVWMGTTKPNLRNVYKGLSRYTDSNLLHDLAEAESGWDMTPRFNRKALNFLPIDLNAFLYKYEMDFSKASKILNNRREAARWEDLANQRKAVINELMWDKSKKFYFDYNYLKNKKGQIYSLAAYVPLWAGMVDHDMAKYLVKQLKRFEYKGGLATTDTLPVGQFVLGSMPTQWAYPNGWAPLHMFVVRGLEKYGYHKEARTIAMKWLKTNLNWFITHQNFIEKYNVVRPEKPPFKGVYPSQEGFGWTNAIFEDFCRNYVDRRE